MSVTDKHLEPLKRFVCSSDIHVSVSLAVLMMNYDTLGLGADDSERFVNRATETRIFVEITDGKVTWVQVQGGTFA